MNAHRYPHGHVFYRRMNHPHPVIVRSEGVWLYDMEGQTYLDGTGGAIVVNAGHGVPEISKAITKQIENIAYIHPTIFSSEVVEDYSDCLAEIVPVNDPKFYYLTSGAEAIEAAIKLARQIQVERGENSRYLTISRWMSYHGLSMGALALSGRPKMRELFEPMFRDMPHIPPPFCYRCPYNLKHPECGLRCAEALEEEIIRHGPEKIVAFLAEPVSGSTLGAVVPPDGYWKRIQEICTQYGVLLILDEVMTGMGRTGKWFAAEHWQLTPDIIAIGKGAASGYFPLSIVAVDGQEVDLIASGRGDFFHGGTFSHHAVGAAAGLATYDYLVKHQLVKQAHKRGIYLARQLEAQLGSLPWIGDIRGIGLMWGIEFVQDKISKAPFPKDIHLNQKIADEALKIGLVVYPGMGCVDGSSGDHLMIGPPFCISEDEIDQLVDLLVRAIKNCLCEN